jgi:hypothetical protein
MSAVNLLSAISEGSEIKERLQMLLEMTTKSSFYSYVYKILTSNNNVKLINFDISFLKYLNTAKKFKFNQDNHFNFFSNILERINLIEEVNKSRLYIIVGLDLLDKEILKKFITLILSKIPKYLIIFSLEKNFLNLNSEVEHKKNIVKNISEIYVVEKTKKIKFKSKNKISSDKFNNKNISNYNTVDRGLAGDLEIYLLEAFNLAKSTVEFVVFEYKICYDSSQNFNPVDRIEFDNVSMYKKDHKDLFEINDVKEKDVVQEPSSTFNLQIKEKDNEAKKNIILPYLKENNENLIQIDQDDLNELYEEDPDEDLDI